MATTVGEGSYSRLGILVEWIREFGIYTGFAAALPTGLGTSGKSVPWSVRFPICKLGVVGTPVAPGNRFCGVWNTGTEGEPRQAGRGYQARGASSGIQMRRQIQTLVAPETGPCGAGWVLGLRAGGVFLNA